ncbi:MAG TPA: 2-dehydro-3-deoxy-6-phosphogalactonate aldolase [Steroidobacteraceae bacterium]|nr:2-dehydro-3-deoxy-6-phosphogalactonate aldolase [Steroidobacteraceae bacterium]
MISEASTGESALVAILRGVAPERVVEIGDALYDAGIRIVEVPLNSPEPFASIAKLVACGRRDWTIGAGTVLNVDDVRRTHEVGGHLVVAPNLNADVIRCALELAMQVIPGIATATEAFDAIDAGARQLKLFPAVTYGPHHLQALRAVLPSDVNVFPVGGIERQAIPRWLTAGAAGFGFGSELFRPDYSVADIGRRARDLMHALRQARAQLGQG